MKIGFFTNFYLPQTAGIVTLIEDYRKELEEQGHQVFIFAPKYPRYQDKSSRVFRFKSIDLRYKMSYPLPIVSSPRIGKTIKELKLDIIHAHHFFACGQIAWYYATKFNIPLVFTHHTRYDLCSDYVPILPKEISGPLIQLSCAFYSDTCDGVIAPSQDVKNLLLKYKVKAPIAVLPSGINLARFLNNEYQIFGEVPNLTKKSDVHFLRSLGNADERARLRFSRSLNNNEKIAREKYNLDKDNILLLSVSRLSPEKNFPFLLKTFQKIESECPNARFMLVGDGPSRKDLEYQSKKLGLKGKVIFTGEIPSQKVPCFYSFADIFIFGSTAETQGLVIVEAMASGLPVVAVEANGIRDIITHKENGILTSYNANEFSKAVLSLMQSPKLREKIVNNARRTVKNYSVETSAKRLVRFYEKVQIQKKQKKKKITDLIKIKSNFNIFFNKK